MEMDGVKVGSGVGDGSVVGVEVGAAGGSVGCAVAAGSSGGAVAGGLGWQPVTSNAIPITTGIANRNAFRMLDVFWSIFIIYDLPQ